MAAPFVDAQPAMERMQTAVIVELSNFDVTGFLRKVSTLLRLGCFDIGVVLQDDELGEIRISLFLYADADKVLAEEVHASDEHRGEDQLD